MSHNTHTTAKPAGAQPEPHHMPAFSTSGAMSLMWQRAASKMNLQELEWMADGAARQVQSEADSLADVLMNTGSLVQSDDGGTGAFMDTDSAASLIFNIRNQLCTIAGLADIAADAGYRARLVLKGGAA
jgi:hypothetical protein